MNSARNYLKIRNIDQKKKKLHIKYKASGFCNLTPGKVTQCLLHEKPLNCTSLEGHFSVCVLYFIIKSFILFCFKKKKNIEGFQI